jgi:quercetin dioxygenase-like cupin family protein
MNYKRTFRIAAGLSGLALAFGVGVAVGQNAPTETKGVKISPPTALDLEQEIDDVSGRQLRLRLVTLEPGGVVGIHSHKGRPAVAYVLQGTLTEHVEGKGDFVHRTGESWTEGKDVTHWAENKGDQPVVVLAVDVFKP